SPRQTELQVAGTQRIHPAPAPAPADLFSASDRGAVAAGVVPGEMQPGVLGKLTGIEVCQWFALGFCIDRGKRGRGQELAGNSGGAASIYQVVYDQPASAVALYGFEH